MEGSAIAGAQAGMAASEEEEQFKFKRWATEKGIDLNSLSEADLAAIYADYEGQRATIDKQRAMSAGIRQEVTGNMGGIQAGNVFVADTPMAGLGAVAAIGADAYAQKKAGQKEDALSAQNAQARESYAGALSSAVRGAGGQPTPQPQAAPLSVEGADWTEEERRRLMGY